MATKQEMQMAVQKLMENRQVDCGPEVCSAGATSRSGVEEAFAELNRELDALIRHLNKGRIMWWFSRR